MTILVRQAQIACSPPLSNIKKTVAGVYLRPNVYIYLQKSIFMTNGCFFLWVIRVLQTVGAQIRAVGPRKRLGWSNFSDFGLQTTHF